MAANVPGGHQHPVYDTCCPWPAHAHGSSKAQMCVLRITWCLHTTTSTGTATVLNTSIGTAITTSSWNQTLHSVSIDCPHGTLLCLLICTVSLHAAPCTTPAPTTPALTRPWLPCTLQCRCDNPQHTRLGHAVSLDTPTLRSWHKLPDAIPHEHNIHHHWCDTSTAIVMRSLSAVDSCAS